MFLYRIAAFNLNYIISAFAQSNLFISSAMIGLAVKPQIITNSPFIPALLYQYLWLRGLLISGGPANALSCSMLVARMLPHQRTGPLPNTLCVSEMHDSASVRLVRACKGKHKDMTMLTCSCPVSLVICRVICRVRSRSYPLSGARWPEF